MACIASNGKMNLVILRSLKGECSKEGKEDESGGRVGMGHYNKERYIGRFDITYIFK